MKHSLLLLAIAAGFGALSMPLQSQAPAPATPAAGVTAAGILQQLQTIRDDNAKLLEQQAAALQKLDEMEKESQALKVLGKRS
jgi:hypothetical protein